MSRRSVLKVGLYALPVATAASVVGAGGCHSSNDPSPDGTDSQDEAPDSENQSTYNGRLNVIWISADDLGIRLGAYGDTHALTPNIDAFAERAMTFERVYCQVAICSASRSSILTGVRPSTSGLLGLRDDWRESLPDATSLPRHLRDQGYFSHGIGKLFDSRSGEGDAPYDEAQLDGKFEDEEVAIKALRKRAKGEGPFFLGIGFSAPHCPHHPSQKSLEAHEKLQEEMPGPGRTLHADSERECLAMENLELSEEDAREITVRYYASVTDLDTKVGRLLDEIEALGLFDSSVVIFWCGDHGYHLGEGNVIGKLTNHVFSTQVPLIMHVPGRTEAGSRSPRLVECVDMYPTLVDLLNLEQPGHELEGSSFSPLLTDPDRKWKRAAFSQWKSDLSVKTERYNFIAYEDEDTPDALYDLDADPQENVNIADHADDVVREMRKLLKEGWKESRPPRDP